MADDREDAKARLDDLRRSYARELPARIRDLAEAWKRLDDGPWDRDGFQAFHRGVHGLAGSGAMFGFAELTGAARSLDLVLKGFGPGDRAPDRDLAKRIADGLDAIRDAARPAE